MSENFFGDKEKEIPAAQADILNRMAGPAKEPSISIGRIVHVMNKQIQDRPMPAMVTHVWENGTIDVSAFPRMSGIQLMSGVPQGKDVDNLVYGWFWPPRS